MTIRVDIAHYGLTKLPRPQCRELSTKLRCSACIPNARASTAEAVRFRPVGLQLTSASVTELVVAVLIICLRDAGRRDEE